MDRAKAKLWTTALRSGEFYQGRGALQDCSGQYCCLGVLGMVAKREGLQIDIVQDEDNDTLFDGNYGSLPSTIRLWAGMSSSHGDYGIDENYESALSTDNDLFHLTFDQIADIIDYFADDL
jgi:hypothetical protein